MEIATEDLYLPKKRMDPFSSPVWQSFVFVKLIVFRYKCATAVY